MERARFRALVGQVTSTIAGAALDGALERKLNRELGAGGETFRALEAACREGIAEGWMCTQGEGRRKFGRIFEPSPDLAGFSVDVVDIDCLVGNYHRDPGGEIDLIMPVTPEATFDARGAGWLVYAPGSGHRPTVKRGRVLVLYLLPGGKIEWVTAY